MAKKPTFEKLNYALRPAKNVERKMLCESFAKLARIENLSKYRYVGMGAVAFVDFSLFHQRLGINDMISVEQYDDREHRIKFNRPYSCIKMKYGKTETVIPQMRWASKRHIVWLDYDDHLNLQMLTDVQYLAARVKSGSVIAVTVTADLPDDPDPTKPKAKAHLDKLRASLGNDKVSPQLQPSDLAQWGTAGIYRDIIHADIEQAIRDRNDLAATEDEKVEYKQLFYFHYQDGTKMLTVGGIILNTHDSKLLKMNHFSGLEFIRQDNNSYLIQSPNLTLKEMRLLDSRLPAKKLRLPTWLPKDECEKYKMLYRFFPSFIEVELR